MLVPQILRPRRRPAAIAVLAAVGAIATITWLAADRSQLRTERDAAVRERDASWAETCDLHETLAELAGDPRRIEGQIGDLSTGSRAALAAEIDAAKAQLERLRTDHRSLRDKIPCGRHRDTHLRAECMLNPLVRGCE